jgi:hypothetical protein
MLQKEKCLGRMLNQNNFLCQNVLPHLHNFYIVSSFFFNVATARQVFERAVEFYGEEYIDEKLFLAFGRFEENCKEVSMLE